MNGQLMSGRWVAIDAFFFAKPFGQALLERFGPAGLVVFLSFICKCKDGNPPGTITYSGGEPGGLAHLGLVGLQLVDNRGEKWTLDDLWRFTGERHTTKRRRRGDVLTVIARHWDEWQRERERYLSRERKRRWREKNERDISVTAPFPPRDASVPVTPSTSTSTATATSPPTPSRTENGDGFIKDPLAERAASLVGHVSYEQAVPWVNELRDRGVGDVVIDEALGYAEKRGDVRSLAFVEKVAMDWFVQRTEGR
jgi:hypothetical protein